jgi:hypothetical protein
MAVSIGRTENTCIINLDKKVADKKKDSSPSAKQEPDDGKVLLLKCSPCLEQLRCKMVLCG